eukprot:CAMPEP_0185363898 /NCGR_PEP_ID=MMETSP1364-20130426/12042_1 /TAXON_ID=38817 /ORGANISM="Gephyrocapsa oceanica, Strain RCC1303" /LENGTH=141 /DNA_ID=CAMNT_0027964369 /DNA_START=201 /DNA_END=626 /DNA_ORIENTATION=-
MDTHAVGGLERGLNGAAGGAGRERTAGGDSSVLIVGSHVGIAPQRVRPTGLSEQAHANRRHQRRRDDQRRKVAGFAVGALSDARPHAAQQRERRCVEIEYDGTVGAHSELSKLVEVHGAAQSDASEATLGDAGGAERPPPL